MFKINKKLEYGLMALKHMAQKPHQELTTAKELCVVYGVPFDVMAKVLQNLASDQWLRVEHGAKGGYRLDKNLNEVSFLNLVETLVGPVHVVNCTHEESHDCALTDSCNVVEPLKNLNGRIKNFYQTIMVADLILTQSAHKNVTPSGFVV